MLAGVKAASLICTPGLGGDPYSVLEAALRSHLLGCLGGDADRDVDGLVTHRDATGCLYTAMWQGHPRLVLGMAVDLRNIADVLLVATKGRMQANESIFGRTGPSLGNSLLVARLLHVAAFSLRSAGVVAVRNDPFDARVRQLYSDMGFENGERLWLDDLAGLTTMFDYVTRAYQHPAARGRLSLATPPLPL